MTSSSQIQVTSKRVETMSGIQGLVGKKMTKKIKFMGQDVEISKLSVSQVLEIQEASKDAEKSEKEGFEALKKVLRFSVEDANDLSDEDFDTFPLDELVKASNQIMAFSGIGDQQKAGK